MKNLKLGLLALTLMFAFSLSAQKKISQLPELTTAQSTDVIPIVNSGATKQIQVQNLLNLSIVNDSLKISGGNAVALPSGSACQYTSFDVETIDGTYEFTGCFTVIDSFITGYISIIFIYENGILQDSFSVNAFLPLFNTLNGEPNVLFSDDEVLIKSNENIKLSSEFINIQTNSLLLSSASEINLKSTIIYIYGALSFKDKTSTEWVNANAGKLMITDGTGTGDVFGTSGILFIRD